MQQAATVVIWLNDCWKWRKTHKKHTYLHVHIYTHMRAHTHKHICTKVCTKVYVNASIHTFTPKFTHTYKRTHRHSHVYVCVCTHIYPDERFRSCTMCFPRAYSKRVCIKAIQSAHPSWSYKQAMFSVFWQDTCQYGMKQKYFDVHTKRSRLRRVESSMHRSGTYRRFCRDESRRDGERECVWYPVGIVACQWLISKEKKAGKEKKAAAG